MINATAVRNHKQNVKIVDMFLYEIPIRERHDLCKVLGEQNVWEKLAHHMGYNKSEIQQIRWSAQQSNNLAPEELLTSWGEQNHTITELFVLLSRIQQFAAMIAIKNLVDSRYHRLILRDQTYCKVSENNNQNEKMKSHYSISKKILNGPIEIISNENNESELINSKIDCDALDVNECASTIPKIDYEELRVATNNWSDKHVLGKGGFGTVFKGQWKCTAVAIKRIEPRGSGTAEMSKIQMQQSLNELRYLNTCRHDNILPLYGYSINGENPCLVYQLMSGGSLAQRLSENKTNKPLQWHQRVNIAVGTARGLQYLHTFSVKPLIHGDIKPANILLDPCCQPKIGDFGLAREGTNDATMEVSRVYGTRPYLPAEFLGHHALSTKVDTFSFGVVLFELATGLKAYDRDYKYLTNHVRSHAKNEDNLLELIAKMPPCTDNSIFKIIMKLGIVCTNERHENRPEMVIVLKHLEIQLKHFITN